MTTNRTWKGIDAWLSDKRLTAVHQANRVEEIKAELAKLPSPKPAPAKPRRPRRTRHERRR